MAIDVCNLGSGSSGSLRSGECINCGKCRVVCPKEAVRTPAAYPLPGAVVTAVMAGLIMLSGVITVVPAENSPAVSSNSSVQTAEAQSDDQESASPEGFSDGVYTGSGNGYRGNISVVVTVDGSRITKIELNSSRDDAQFFNRAWNTVTGEIIQAQGVEVDAVSGATYSSRGIISAVADALDLEYTAPEINAKRGKH